MFINMQGQANSFESSATPSNPRQGPRLPDVPYLCVRCSKTFNSSDALHALDALEPMRKKLRDSILQTLEDDAQWNQAQKPILPLPPPSFDDQNLAQWASMMAKPGSGPLFRLDFEPENGQGFIPAPHPIYTGFGAKDRYEALSMAHHLDLNFPPYPFPHNNNMMPLQMYQDQDSDFAARAGLGAWLGEASNAADADAYVGASNGGEDFNEIDLMNKLDLTLKL